MKTRRHLVTKEDVKRMQVREEREIIEGMIICALIVVVTVTIAIIA